MHIGVDVLELPHAIMITTANITDQNGAIDMVNYYCDVTNHLSLVKKLLADGGYTGENFANEIKNCPALRWKSLNAMSCILLLCFLNAGLSSALLPGSTNTADFGKTVSVNYRTLFK